MYFVRGGRALRQTTLLFWKYFFGKIIRGGSLKAREPHDVELSGGIEQSFENCPEANR
jgi:hypothetical protein